MKLAEILKQPQTIEELYQNLLRRQVEIDVRRGMTKAEQAQIIKELFPEVVSETITMAGYGMESKVKLPGTGGEYKTTLSGGQYPAWLDNKYHTNEYHWQLNRMDWWQNLLAAYAFTGENAYAERVLAELRDWTNVVKRPELTPDDFSKLEKNFHSLSPWRVLEVGIRLHKSWPLIMEHLLGDPVLDLKTLEIFVLSVYEQAEILAAVSPQFFPKADHNHYVMENLGLLWASSYFPEFKNAEKWQKQAMAELERCIEVQMTEDGAHIEACPMYHNGCMRWFTLGLLIARDFGLEFSENYKKRLEKGLEYSIYSFRPTGETVPWGDSRANQGAIMGGFYGYLAFRRSDCLNILRDYTSEQAFYQQIQNHIWFLYDIREFKQCLAETSENHMPLLNHQRRVKQAAFRTSWDKQAHSLFFGVYTPIHTGHTHMDPLGFDYTALGQNLLVDPGYYTYENNAMREKFKSPQYHNTIIINDQYPFEYINAFRYGEQKNGDILLAEERADHFAIIGYHDNYQPVRLMRAILLIEGKDLLVLDLVKGEARTADIYYHLATDQVQQIGKSYLGFWPEVQLQMTYSSGLTAEVLEGEYSKDTDAKSPSKRIHLKAEPVGAENLYAALFRVAPKEQVVEAVQLSVAKDANGWKIQISGEYAYQVKWDGETEIVYQGN
ncbi:hypothetical protein EII17_08165 [Clostridiales bacterium COT073_COT-073]|nr:hypothetical protein EII17_08165 [Clostridiales bacterium COT073_COT-073]